MTLRPMARRQHPALPMVGYDAVGYDGQEIHSYRPPPARPRRSTLYFFNMWNDRSIRLLFDVFGPVE